MTDDGTSEPVTADDVGVPVIDSEGNQIGVVAAVDGDDVEIGQLSGCSHRSQGRTSAMGPE